MQLRKRQRDNIDYVYINNKRKKLFSFYSATTNGANKTSFEDLSNELIYEIFDCLDISHVYEGFYDLNSRFQKLLTNSNLPIKINISTMPKSNVQRYNSQIIVPNKHRITFLHLRNSFIIDIVLSPRRIISDFIRLDTLILDNIKSEYLEKILNYALLHLPNLSSLIINCPDEIQYPNMIYNQIFSLPILKYCKITFETIYGLMSPCDTKNSSIEHFILNTRVYLHEIDYLLSSLPHLRRLSIHYLVISDFPRLKINTIQLKHLTHVFLKIICINFNLFSQLIIDYFSNIQVLHISVRYDMTYLNANEWEQFILTHMPHLKIFDLNNTSSHECRKYINENNQMAYQDLIDKFASPFWIERKWVFTNQNDFRINFNGEFFYSTNPYKRKYYRLDWDIDENRYSSYLKTNFDIVNHLYIHTAQAMNNSIHYFPNVTELTFDINFGEPNDSFAIDLNRIFPLSQLTKLTIDYVFPLTQLIKLLCSTPNLHTITLNNFLPFYTSTEYESIYQSESFRMVSNTNAIKNMIINACNDRCQLAHIQMLIALCPRLEQFTTGMYRREFLSIIRLLLTKGNKNTRHLFFLCILKAPKISLPQLKRLIKLENLLDDYLIDYINQKLYLWW